MTTKQHRWYLREWGAAFSAHWSGVRGGEVVARTGRPENHPLREQVLAVARRMLGARGGKLNADVIRHACHVVALGKDIGSMRFTNKQIDQVVAIFRQLAGVNLSALMMTTQAESEKARISAAKAAKASSPDAPTPLPDADRARLIWALDHIDLPPAYLAELARDGFGTANWRSLPTEQLQKLRITAGCRAIARQITGTKRVNVASTL